MIYLKLFLGFLKVGCFSFGGAYAAIPLIRDVVRGYGWMTEDQLAYMIAVSESTPGPIMVNLATFTGATQAGLAGAALATFAVVLPAFLVILLLWGVSPLIQYGVCALLYKFAAALVQPVSDKRLVGCLGVMGEGGSLLLKILYTTEILCMITIAVLAASFGGG